jgi:type VI secretion system protein ImpA
MPLRADLLQPIPGDSPGGVSLRYDPIYDKIKEARREDIDIPQGAWQRALKVADHAQVVKLTGEALATKSKDLQLAVWLVEAIVRREGFAVLPGCFKFLHDLTEQFWDSLFPEIEDGDMELRASPLDWLGSKFEACLRDLPVTSDGLSWFKYKESRVVGYENDATTDVKLKVRNDLLADGKISAETFDQSVDDTPKAFYENLLALVTASLEQLSQLGDLCDAKFGSDAPSLLNTRAALEEIAQMARIFINKKGGPTLTQEAVEPEPDQVQETEPSPQDVPPTVSVSGIAAATKMAVKAGSLEPVDPADAAKRIAATARFLRQQDKYNIAPYMILRGFRWGEIRHNGPNIDPNMLAAPSVELRSALKRFAVEQDWDNVLETTERAMEEPCGRAWLDVHRYAVRALENKGEYFAFMAQAIRTGLRGLLQDLPVLLDLTLMDDTPTANPETLTWIKQDILPPPVQAVPASNDAPVIETLSLEPPSNVEREVLAMEKDLTAVDEVFEAALSKARSGYLHEAIEIISNELATERTGRGRFKRRIQLTHLMVGAGKSKIAYPILKQLAAEIESRHLEEWESGRLLSYPLGLLLECARQEDDAALSQQTYARICEIDPLYGLKFGD